MQMTAGPGPHLLSGLRILDLGTMVAGPVAATLFGDFGAEVIKVEVPRRGDTVRDLGPFVEGRCLYWSVENRNKKSITLDLRKPEGRELLLDLVAHADAVVENFRPGTLEKWGCGWDVLKARNPQLIMLRISGFGQTGPYRERAGYDRIALAFGGLMGITGFPDRPPVRIGTSIADYQSAILGAFALMMAIYHRDMHGGEGQQIDLAMYESIIRFTEVLVPAYDRLGTVRERRGNKHFAAAPGEHFRTADGRYMILTVSADAGFQRLAQAMGRRDWLEDPRYATHEQRWRHVDELNTALAAWIEAQPVDELCAILDDAKLAYSFIYSIEDIMNDPHYQARGTIASVPDPHIGPVKMAGVVPKFPDRAEKPIEPAPDLGQHNGEIYGELLGLSPERLAALNDAGVI
ncbi:CaiB/BaiF CoA transferase family protein [Cupriavidus plantarum]|uniref:Crotonobetainyl-CoA:carnitine CoA-transferase CaiB-like acyl-CoA transferase n=1 Tax=Cupriavidus plantarum TaxID=942865 RepID=A0A316F1L1_9BURK|nr:CaiB/BaiF CoA-transferase family protein [Cupriavidus plantarum]PWK38571.1 crotonobetainyl-CoA:carnitine CoA-transferase CaiB-like acyl-CoA transferase [Cupriavidus plantarum]CAG2127124.1 Succinyl-CoA--L-malate CoA-transferase alpha subunit [Cupriavidus plantarum]SMR67579.1 Crotonobetainyl-CoA:carnitine CoA-transferase CaiB [Cupriavidus plantarum]